MPDPAADTLEHITIIVRNAQTWQTFHAELARYRLAIFTINTYSLPSYRLNGSTQAIITEHLEILSGCESLSNHIPVNPDNAIRSREIVHLRQVLACANV